MLSVHEDLVQGELKRNAHHRPVFTFLESKANLLISIPSLTLARVERLVSWNRYFRRGFVIVFKRCPTKDGLYLYPLYRWTACFPIFVMKFTFPQLICQIQFRSLFFRWSKGRWSIWNGTVSPVASSHWLKTVALVIFRIWIFLHLQL